MFYFSHHIGNVILPFDFHSIIFVRGVGEKTHLAASDGSGMIHRSVPAAFQLRAAQVFFKCDPGYASFDGDDHIICTSQGTWLLAGIGVHEWGSHRASTKVKCWYNSDFSGISLVYEVYVYGSTLVRYLSTLTCCYRWVKCTNHLRMCFFGRYLRLTMIIGNHPDLNSIIDRKNTLQEGKSSSWCESIRTVQTCFSNYPLVI